MAFDNYSSHLLVFEKLFEAFQINHVLEFGTGKYSTGFFVGKCQSVISVEQSNRQWYDKMKAEINSPNWTLFFEQDPRRIFSQTDARQTKLDLVFSDGSEQTRHIVANLAMQRNVPLVVLHDAEKVWYYKWNLLEIPGHYSRFDFCHHKGVGKVTTILANTRTDELESWVIPEHTRVLLAYSSPKQQVFQLPYHLVCELTKK